MPRTARAYIGTSGWNYRHWRGRFYPQKLRQADWLPHFAARFDTVEVNNSFYRIPTPESVRDWAEQVPGRFRFAVKLWQGITHRKKLKDCRDRLERFFEPIAALPTEKRGPVLIQLPGNQGKDIEKLDAFLDDLKHATHPQRWKVAVEFRNPQWLCSEVYELLDRHHAAICLHDMKPADVTLPNDASIVYVRRHGPGGDYQGAYTDEQIENDAENIAHWTREGRTVFVYFNNDAEGNAVHDARRLQGVLGQSG